MFRPCVTFASVALILSGCTLGGRVQPPHVVARPPAYGIGLSCSGRALVTYRFGPDDAPVVLIFAGIHGDEPASATVAERLVDALSEHPPTDRRVVLLPVANPDGLAAGTRVNARGVDLNRNFPAQNWTPAHRQRERHGTQPLSEPESRALTTLIETLDPVLIVSIHAISGGRFCNNYDGPGQAVATTMSNSNHYPVRASIGYPTPGSFGSWAGRDRGIAVITLELPAGQDGDTAWAANHAALLAAIALANQPAPTPPTTTEPLPVIDTLDLEVSE